MDSDDSRDELSSGSDSDTNQKRRRSPNSVHSNSRDSSPRQSSPRGPRSPSPCGPRSPSPEGSIQSSITSPINSPIASPKRSPSGNTIKSPSQNSIASSLEEENPRKSLHSDDDEDDDDGGGGGGGGGRHSPKSSSSRSSVKSRGSLKSRSSSRPASPKTPDSPHRSMSSDNKSLERRGPVSPPPEDGNSSDSSDSSRGSSRIKSTDRLDAEAEEISDGEMESDGCKDSDDEPAPKKLSPKPKENVKINLSHEDLSEISDLDSLGNQSEEEEPPKNPEPPPKSTTPTPTAIVASKPPVDLRQKIDEAKNRKLNEKVQNPPEKTSKTEDGEEQLDFEAEDGECVEDSRKIGADGSIQEDEEGALGDATPAEKEEVEEGEVTDDDEVRPEETEPRPVCRFYSRGQCTWGASCRFLHPGVTDKGNYTMFELIRPMVPGSGSAFGLSDERYERPSYGAPPRLGGTELPVVESAWERGLRTAKEMMRKAIKRKEQDMDFEEKKMNLTLAQDELDKENGYYTRSASPVPVEPAPRHYVSVRHPVDYRPPGPAQEANGADESRRRQIANTRQVVPFVTKARVPEEYFNRRVVYDTEPRAVRIEPEYEVPRERIRTYRELPAHRMPDYYNDKYEEPVVTSRRPKREVIVQRVEPSGGGGGPGAAAAAASAAAAAAAGGGGARGDEWADPWMRSKSPGGRGKVARFAGSRRQSYSSASSYSSSSSSASSKTSYRGVSRSRSRSPTSRLPRSGPPTTTRRPVPLSGGLPPKSPSASHRLHRIPAGATTARPVSPSVIVSEKKAANERALLMNPPAPNPKKAQKDNRPPSPGMMRTSAQNPPAPPSKGLTDQYGRTRDRSKHESDRKKLAVAAAIAASVKSRARISRSTSGSDSSGSSSSDSESSYSSTSSSRDGSPTPRRKVSEKVELAAMALKAKALDALKTGTEKRIKLSLKSQQLKKPSISDLSELSRKVEKGEALMQGKKRVANSPPPSDLSPSPKMGASGKVAANNKKATSRREELLKQLKAVEDAIAKKRSKIN